ncbi:MAG TPA: BrnA antitoxin family protein [Candidatus Sulfotelmatobacter sp.]|nr:BrnA antitoxin family protein [Candidatus Sulfotelmatobacter sp.]
MRKSAGARAKRATARANRKTDWSGLRRRTSKAIHDGIAADPDAHATDAAFWKSARVVLPTPKEAVTMRLDADLLRWFRRERGYQTRINAILRAYMQAHES